VAYVVVILSLNTDLVLGADAVPFHAIDWPYESLPWYLLPACGLGFLAFSSTPGDVPVERVRTSFVSLLALIGGAICGGFLAGCAYFVLRMLSAPAANLGEAFAQMAEAIQSPHDLLRLFLLAGAVSGLIAMLYFRGGHLVQNVARIAAGVGMGAVVGLIIYVFAYVLINYPQIPDSSYYLVHFAEAVYSFTAIEFGFLVFGSAIGATMSRYSWRLYGIFALTSLLAVISGYLLYSLAATLPNVPAQKLPFALVLFAAETASLTMVALYSFYTIDVATRKRWKRAPKATKFSKYFVPKVALHVPTFNEPPELVIESLRALLDLDYPEDRFVVMVGDDSTNAESSVPLRQFCERSGIVYVHREDRKGYKAGALNGLMARTPEDVDLVAVIDADYRVEPEWLQETVGYFIDPLLAWVQTPQDYSNPDQSFLTKQYYLADKYFYRTILPSRNEENSIIFCGTMGILRRQALDEAGGWGEDYITEDAELSVRLLTNGWHSLYVNKTYGRGLIPGTFGGYKKQHYRWAFGGGQVMRGHFVDIFFGRLSGRQRFDYLVGNMHWFEGLFLLVIASSILIMGVGEVLGYSITSHHANEILLIGLVPWFLLVDGFTRLHMVLRRNLRLTFGGTVRVLGMWMAVKFSNSFAALKGALGFKIPFVRTPKAPHHRLTFAEAAPRALRTTPFESTAAGLLLFVGAALFVRNWQWTHETGILVLARWLLCVWLLYYALIFAAAPIYAYKSYTTFDASPAPAPASVPNRARSVTP
jgi:cellulose synthase/poly-beta-1,6-N-acetylglucosamine synthase-like glycosyltransferase